MFDQRTEKLLQGHSSLARKVFEAVPIQEPWHFEKIQRTLYDMGKSAANVRTIHACLGQLKDAGIIREPDRYHFQRSAMIIVKTPKEIEQMSKPAVAVSVAKKPAVAPAAAAPVVAEVKESPMELVMELAEEVTAIQREFNERLGLLFTRIEAAAIQVQCEVEANADAAVRLKQLTELLRG